MKNLTTPLKEKEVRSLRVNDPFTISGKIFTARDAAHEKLLRMAEAGKDIPIPLSELPCFHCGPVMKKGANRWKVVSAGPTTSIRMEIFEEEFMARFGTRLFIGKGGMGENTSRGLKKVGGVYAQFTGGAGSLMAGAVKEVEDVFFLDELGIPEAVWIFKVENFGPLLTTMDSEGSSIHRDLSKEINSNLERIKKSL